MTTRSVWIVACVAGGIGLLLAIGLSEMDARRGGTTPGAAESGRPERIICMAPNIAEAVFALGGGDRVAGVSDYTVYPPEAKAKPRVGALYNPNIEVILSLRPDLVIIQQKHEKVERFCRDNGISVLRVDMEGLDGILGGIGVLGDRLLLLEQAEALRRRILADLDAVRQRVEGRPRTKVFFCLGRTPGSLKGLFTVGKTSFLTELIEIAGGENVFAEVDAPYPQVSAETLLARVPEVIVETHPSKKLSADRREAILADWRTMPAVPAVRSGRVHLVTDDCIVVPGPRVARIAALLAGLFHPEAPDAR